MGNEREDLVKKIVDAQQKLREVNPDHPLLGMVEITPMGIIHTAEFDAKYGGIVGDKAFEEYVSELVGYSEKK